MSLIVLPTAQMQCECGKPLASHPAAARWMGVASMLASAGPCKCGSLVLRGPHQLVHSGGRNPVCEWCDEAKASTRIQHIHGAWGQWYLSCFDERKAPVAERVRDAHGPFE